MTKNSIKSKIDIAVLMEKVEKIEENVNLIINNHIPHMHARIDEIEKKFSYYTGGLAVLIVIVQYLLRFLFK